MATSVEYAFQIALETAYADGGSSFTDLPVFIDGRPKMLKDIHESAIYRGSIARSTFYTGKKWYEVAAKFFLKGSGTPGTAPELSKLLQIFGLKETVSGGVSVVYAPDDATADKSGGIKINLGGVQYYMKGVRGSLKVPLVAGQPVLCEANLIGCFNAPTAVATPTPSYTDLAIDPPPVQTMALLIGGNSHIIPQFTLMLENQIEHADSINAGTGQNGINELVIVRRNYGFEALVEVDGNNDIEYWTNLNASTEMALASTGFGAAGTKIAIAAGALQLEDVEPVEHIGKHYYQIKGRINYNASEFSLTLT